MAHELTEDTFDDVVLQSQTPVLVDFWAPTCGPCRKLGPVIDKLSQDNDGKAKVVKVDVNQNMSLAAKYGVTMLPTLLVFKGGEVVETQVGLVPAPKLQEMIDAHVTT